MKRIIIFGSLSILFCFTFTNQNAQVFNSLRSPYAYLAGTAEPDSDWYLPEYDDSGWGSDTGLIGYGYGVEDIPIDKNASSIYMRFRFHIESKDEFKKGSFYADFDDGYIAYLNGKEIVRVNIDQNTVFPGFDATTNRSHEMQLNGWDDNAILGYYLDSLLLDSCLVEGGNVIAVQVLNDSTNGSDLQFRMSFYNSSYGDYNIYNREYKYKRQYTPDSTSLPLVVIETDEFGIPYHHIRRKAFMGIIDNGEGKYNQITDSCNVYYGDISVELRGQSSKDFPKRSYRLELIDSLGLDSNVVLLGMPADDDWILLGPMHDKALFRNPMVFDMGRNLNGSYQPRNRFCEVIFNGEYIGVYSLLETIKRDKDRIYLAKLREEEISGIDLTGGYILRFDKPGGPFQIVYPKSDKIQPEQETYIRDYYKEYTDVLLTRYFTDPETGYRQYINDTSMIDYLIVNEITKNADSYLFSTYFYKDRDDRDPRFHFGPIWDMNLAFGNSTFQYGDRWDEWQFDNQTNTNYKLKTRKLFQDEVLVDLFQERWHAAREGVFRTDVLLAYIDSMVTFLEEARIRNYTVWPVIDEDIFQPNYQSMTYEEEIYNMTSWLVNRLDWIDDNIDDIFYTLIIPNALPQSIDEFYFSYDIYPNPFIDELVLEISSSEDAEIQLEIYDMMGRKQLSYTQMVEAGNDRIIIESYEIQNIASGLYIMNLSVNGSPFSTQRIIKQ